MAIILNNKRGLIAPAPPSPTPDAQLSLLEQPVQPRGFVVQRQAPVAGFEKAKQQTGIEWTNATWNPMVGCSIHTAGCKNCYAMKQAGIITAKHYEGVVKWVGAQGGRDSVWTGKINQAHMGIINKPRTLREPTMIFVNSMSDFFHEDMPYQFQIDAMKVMEETPRHIYQILTKRPENIDKFIQQYGYAFPRNVWVGATMEREDYRHRIDTLRKAPAHIKFLSVEPLIGPPGEMDLTDIQWTIVGGESGPNSREMKAEWVRSARDDAVSQLSAFFFKQWGIKENNPIWQEGGDEALRKQDPVGKGGSLIDGVAWKEFPVKYEFDADGN